ncbi:MAG: riboflavin synthase [Phycisphaerae bacterium]|mgnify:CR=1 FL=1|nr:riboflavin synthase [Phycisphaerae bacterium]
MFTGLIQRTAIIAAKDVTATGIRLVLEPPSAVASDRTRLAPSPLSLGESIAVQGCCLTLVSEEDGLRFDVIHQTLSLTTLGRLGVGTPVNIERSATPTTLLGGHLVQGHVDGVGRIVLVSGAGGEWRVRVASPGDLMRYLMPRGSITIDGVSLTVAAVDDATGTFDVCLIPETLARTTLGSLKPDSEVNLEADCVAKMVERTLAWRG